jgi:hypothetical protein
LLKKKKKKRADTVDLVPIEQEWYYDDEAKVHYYEDGHYWFESRSVDVCQPIEDTPLGNTNIQFSMEIDVKAPDPDSLHCLLQCYGYLRL